MSKRKTKNKKNVVTPVEKSVTESINMFESTGDSNIDEKNMIVKNVCIMGTPHSTNGYDYTEKAMESLAELSEQAPLFMNHPTDSEDRDSSGVRSVYHWGGVFFNSRKEGQKVFADLKVRGKENWEIVRDIAVMKPKDFGNSINSRVKTTTDMAGKESVVDIARLKSIDMVTRAATTTTLFESESDYEEVTDEEIKDFYESSESYDFKDNLEGILKDKILEKRIKRVIRDLQWESQDIINDVLVDKEKSIEEKKSEIGSILDDLENEINSIMSLKGDTEKTETHKEESMEYSELTLEQIKAKRPDLVDAIEGAVEDASKVAKLESDASETAEILGKTKEALEALKEENTTLKAESDKTAAELDKFKLEEVKTKKESFIATKISDSELPEDAISDFFMKDLMTKDEDAIEAAILDRKEAWEVKPKDKKVVKGAGDEFVSRKESTQDESDAADAFLKALKS